MNQKVGRASRYEAADATGSIHIEVNSRALVLSVSINEGWRRKLAPDQFADAPLGAYREAIRTAISSAATEGNSATSGRAASQVIANILREYDDDDVVSADWYTGIRARLNRIKQRRKAVNEYIAARNVDYMLEFVDKLGIPAGYYAGAATAAVFVAMVDLLTDVASRFMATVSDERKIDSIMTDNSALPGGKWPEAVVG